MIEIKLNHKNWIGSAIGLIPKSATITETNAVTIKEEKDENGFTRKIAKSGSVYSDTESGIYGLILDDIDITSGSNIGSVVVAGHYIAENLPAAVSTEVAGKFVAQGLFPVIEGGMNRPEWAKKS